MPSGYTSVNAAFGIRAEGLSSAEGVHQIPAVEFRTNGDYAMYPFATDCNGNFSHGQGMVFAPDGTVREQLAEMAQTTLANNPQFQPLADKVCAMTKAAIAATPDDATHRKTRYGLLQIDGESGQNRLTFNDHPVREGASLSFVRSFQINGTDVVLLSDNSSGNGCPGGEFFFITVRNAQDVIATPTFGDCREGAPRVNQAADTITVEMPAAEGESSDSYSYRNGEVTGDQIHTDGAASEVDAAQAAADAATAAADAATSYADAASSATNVDAADAWADAAQSAADAAASNTPTHKRPSSRWVAMCVAQSRKVTTPAGSQVGLNEDEAATYCQCLQSQAPQSTAAITGVGGDFSVADQGEYAARWRLAQTQCINQLL